MIKFSDVRSLEKVKKFVTGAEDLMHLLDKDRIFFVLNILTINKENLTSVFLQYTSEPNSKAESISNKSSMHLSLKKPLKLNSEIFSITMQDNLDRVDKESNIPYIISNMLHSGKSELEIDLKRILDNKEKRTTIMIRNIPNRYTQYNIVDIININYRGLYDFIYLPTDLKVVVYFIKN